jgi:hypothetical protein
MKVFMSTWIWKWDGEGGQASWLAAVGHAATQPMSAVKWRQKDKRRIIFSRPAW